MATLIKKIDELLNNNRLDTAIDLAQSAIENVDREYHNTLILLKSQLRGNETDFGKNLITRNEYTQTKARILTGFQNLLESFPKSVLESHVNDLEITGNGKISLQDTGNSTININKQPQNQTSMLTPLERAQNSIINNGTGNLNFQGIQGSTMNVTVSNVQENSNKIQTKSKILFLAANPTDTARLQTDKEYKTIRERLRISTQRDTFELLMPELALTIENLVLAMNQKPAIVHFSGHGETNGIVITNSANEHQLLPIPALTRLFRQHKETTHLIILNACYSAEQAKVISEIGFYVIGMNKPIEDGAAIDFATGLYIGLGEGKTVELAFDDAMIILIGKHSNADLTPEVWKNGQKLDL